MIITCPHCQTKYQVTYEAIGSAGRKVQCAHCNQAWQQEPLAPELPPPPTDPITEDALDEAMASEAEAVVAERAEVAAQPEASPPKPAKPMDVAEIKKRQKAFTRRQSVMASRLPYARMRRGARALGLVMLTGMVAWGYMARVDIVQRYPDLAGVYEAVGLGVNVVGLEFDKLATLESLDQGSSVLDVSAQIVGLRSRPVSVPPVVISLLDASGKAVYEWSVAPKVSNLMAGERATFSTRLTLPPSDASRVRLSFVGYGSTPMAQGVTPPGADEHGSDAAPHGAEAHAPAEAGHGTAPAADAHGAPAAADHAAPAADAHGADAHAPAGEAAAAHATEAAHGSPDTHAPAEAGSDHGGAASPAATTHH